MNADSPQCPALSGDDLRDADLCRWNRRIEVVLDKSLHGPKQKYVRVVYKNIRTRQRLLGDVDKHDMVRVHRVFAQVLKAQKAARGVDCAKLLPPTKRRKVAPPFSFDLSFK